VFSLLKAFEDVGLRGKQWGKFTLLQRFLLSRSVAGAGVLRLLLLVSLGFYEIESVSRQLSEEEERRFHQFEEEEENED
jgi:hypothetical protein